MNAHVNEQTIFYQFYMNLETMLNQREMNDGAEIRNQPSVQQFIMEFTILYIELKCVSYFLTKTSKKFDTQGGEDEEEQIKE